MLPKIEQPYYNTQLPISKETVRYRPYLVKEEKVILIAMAGGEDDDIKGAIAQIISNCTDGQVDATELNSIDISFLMAKIRSASKGGIVDIGMRCKNEIEVPAEDGDENAEKQKIVCNHLNSVPVDLESMSLTNTPTEIKDTIEISESLGIKLRMPGLEVLDTIKDGNINIVDVLPQVIDYVYDDDGIYKLRDATSEEIEEFVESLNDEHLKEIDKFFTSIPKLKVEVPFVCEKCGHKETIIINDVQNFF